MANNSLRNAFIEELRDVLSAEKQIVKALPKLAKRASHDELRAAFEHHLEQSQEHIRRVEEAMQSLDLAPRAKKCEAMEGLLEEGAEILESDHEESVLDAMLIGAAQKVEHYEIATYGTLCTWGEVLGLDAAVKALRQNLEEEKEADEKLTDLAAAINAEAAESAAA